MDDSIRAIPLSFPHDVASEKAKFDAMPGCKVFSEKDIHPNGSVTAKPDFIFHDIQYGDEYLVMASDGIWDYITGAEAISIISKFQDMQEAAEALVEEGMSRWAEKRPDGRRDDITAMAVRLLWTDEHKSA
eukprot:g366.t1